MPQCPRHGCDCVIVFVCVYHGSRKRCGPQYNAVSSMIVAVFLMCSYIRIDNAVSRTIVAVCVLITAGPSTKLCVCLSLQDLAHVTKPLH